MAFCSNCGAPLQDGARFCPACGASVAPAAQQAQSDPQPTRFKKPFFQPLDFTSAFDPQDIQQNKLMAVLAYFGILVLVPLLAAKDSKFARFHANQGLILLISTLAYGFGYFFSQLALSSISPHEFFFDWKVLILPLVPLIIGVANAARGKAKELPVIGRGRLLK